MPEPPPLDQFRAGDSLGAYTLLCPLAVGGMGTVFGPVIGAVALLVLEETLPYLIGLASHVLTGREVAAAKEYWQLILGPMLLLIVIYARGGIESLIAGRRRG